MPEGAMAGAEPGAKRETGTVDAAEVARFEALGEQWWDPAGKMRPLHEINPTRLAFVRDVLVRRFGRDGKSLRPLKGIRLVDIGCGGGLLSEPLARMGASVTGVDPAEGNVAVARRHAEAAGVAVDYRATTAEALAEAGETFDAVLALEVVEHVADVPLFVRTVASLVAPGGVLVLSTLNRTAKSFALAIVGAEYVLRWLPPGTHQWDRFITPDELEATLAAAGFEVTELAGMVYEPFKSAWKIAADTSVNYFMVAQKA